MKVLLTTDTKTFISFLLHAKSAIDMTICVPMSVNLLDIDLAISWFVRNPRSCPINYQDSLKTDATIIS